MEEFLVMDLSEYLFYSGGAKGADTIWQETLEGIGAKVMAYRPEHYDKLTQSAKDTIESQYLEVVHTLGRRVLSADKYVGKLVRRDMMQVALADAVFAIGWIDRNGYLSGGTAYSTTRAIIKKLSVYCFDLYELDWLYWNYDEDKFVRTKPPVLTKRACVVGTRDIIEEGIDEIKNTVNRTLVLINR
jgi:hypothetical protein